MLLHFLPLTTLLLLLLLGSSSFSASAASASCSDILREDGADAVKQFSKVTNLPGLENPDDIDTGYAGFFETDEAAANEMYFWYFPAQNGNKSAPLLIWLQGGPGGSSLFGLFAEMGPFSVEPDLTLKRRATSWNNNYGMLFIDNPVGAGFSYTGTGAYCNNTKTCVAENLYSLLQQFYTVFPDQQENELYITGESYAGHYVPAIAFYIHEQRQQEQQEGAAVKIPLAGIAIGDGWVDPINMIPAYPEMMFAFGLADASEKRTVQGYCDKTVSLIEQGAMQDAFNVWDEMLNGDIFPYPNYFHNITGSNDYDNMMNTNEPPSLDLYSQYVQLPAARAAMHTEGKEWQGGSDCEMHLTSDFMVSFADELGALMDNYKVLVYSGQLDIIIGTALTTSFVPLLPWAGRDEFKNAQKKVWRATPQNSEVSGFVTQAREFTFAVVRGAGHLVPFDQGKRALDMVTRFVDGLPYENEPNPAAAEA